MTNPNPPMIVMFTAAQEGPYIPPVIFVDLSSRRTRKRIKHCARELKGCDVTTAKFGETLLVKGYTHPPTNAAYCEDEFQYCFLGMHFGTLTLYNEGRVYYGPAVSDIHHTDLVITSAERTERITQVLSDLDEHGRRSLAEKIRYLVRYGRSCSAGSRRCVLGHDWYDNCFGFRVDEWKTFKNAWESVMHGGLIYNSRDNNYSVHT